MLEQMQAIITQFVEVEKEAIRGESKFIEDLGFNSYDLMCMIGQLEELFDIEMEEREIIKLRTVQDVAHYIENLQIS